MKVEVLGWKAEYTDIKDIIKSTWNWSNEKRNGKYN
jgi:UDP-glucose 4-epimerase